jgi:anti-anti-sigma factor
MNNEAGCQDLCAVVRSDYDRVAAKLPELRTRLSQLLAGGVVHLTLDLSDVQALDSTGIGLLVSAHNSLKKSAGELTVIHASSDVLHLLGTMCIHQHFSVTGS